MSEFNIRVLTPADWLTYKSIRLASLRDAPDSFGSTYERESVFMQPEWESRLDPVGRAKTALPLVAECGVDPVGVAWGLVQDTDLKVAHVFQMWVSPDARGRGIAKALLNRITDWAIGRNCHLIELSVTTTNAAAVGLYDSSGFLSSGQVEDLREGSALKTKIMIKDLRNAA
ncbi:MAG: GNAT family N-acetyltransferase [Gammaproteobacteria bacterium]|nr:GNAT family N-acetyltransferase [Gammaproteobacteria bacterium]|tara:strand:+ start:1175 stop:1690 length:516 start_codon:yes stop_codon:yes gene_type:complete